MIDYYEIIDAIKDSDNTEYVDLISYCFGKYRTLTHYLKIINDAHNVMSEINSKGYCLEDMINFKWIHNYFTYSKHYLMNHILYFDITDIKLYFIGYLPQLKLMPDYEWEVFKFYIIKYPNYRKEILSNLIINFEGYAFKDIIIENYVPNIYRQPEFINELYKKMIFNISEHEKELCDERVTEIRRLL
jgi:hypothetical protein